MPVTPNDIDTKINAITWTNGKGLITGAALLGILSTISAYVALLAPKDAPAITGAATINGNPIASTVSPTFTGIVTAPTLSVTNSATIPFTQSGNGAVASTVDGKLKQSVNLLDFCSTSALSTDATACFTAAYSYAAAAGNVAIVLPAGDIKVCSLVVLSNIEVRGQGRSSNVTATSGCVGPVMYGPANAYSLFGTQVDAGIKDFVLRDFQIDGTSGASTGQCLAVYGQHYKMIGITIQNCHAECLYTEGGAAAAGPMESQFTDINVYECGKTGWYADGPHDSGVNNFTVVDAGTSTATTYPSVHFGLHMNARVNMMHTWEVSTVANRNNAGIIIDGNASDFENSHFEGANGYNVYLSPTASSNSFGCSNKYYANYGGTWNVAVAGSLNRICGTILDPAPGRPASGGITFLNATDVTGANSVANHIDLIVQNQQLAAINFNHGMGGNFVRVNGYAAGAYGYYGTPATSDDVDLIMFGATNAKSFHQHPTY